MAAPTSSSLKEYLKKYESNVTEEEKKKKKKKKKAKPTSLASGVLVVDEDPVWQKPVNLDEEENDSPDENPQVDEDIEVKRMKRLEQIRAKRSYNEISEDGSGWIPVEDVPKSSSSLVPSSDISPPRNRKARYDTPSPEDRPNGLDSGEVADLSPPRQLVGVMVVLHLSLMFLNLIYHHHDSAEGVMILHHRNADRDISPPPRRPRSLSQENPSVSGVRGSDDLSPPRRERHCSPKPNDSGEDLSPPRKNHKEIDKKGHRENSARAEADLSPPRKRKQQQKTGLITGKDVSKEIAITKKDEWSRFNEMDPSASGRGAEPVYRFKGERVSKDEYLKLTKKKEEKPKEDKKLEWGKGLAQKREAEAKLLELELEKEKPFARSRDDPELDSMMKDRIRWGDPMAHLVKKKQPDLLLSDWGENEKMKESGFIIPQDIPTHSWIKRGLDYEPNRYGIKPGRHWDGVNRSNGYEKQLFKRTNEKRATEREAYLWSVSDM
ncbi:BUD13-like protein [Bienertia sinuspersici]